MYRVNPPTAPTGIDETDETEPQPGELKVPCSY